MVAADLPIGDRIRHYRGGRRQDAVTGLVGIAPDYLSQIERGIKVPSLPILYALAQELGVPAAALLSERAPIEEEASDTAEAAVGRALLGYGPARSTEPVASAVLRDRVEAAWQIWQTAGDRFTQAAEVLPVLVADAEHAARAARTGSDAADGGTRGSGYGRKRRRLPVRCPMARTLRGRCLGPPTLRCTL
ncbi:helix-turn-helix domain-containing protein [Streptomyces sp. NPDC101237]|uniref:helix-turn-helix domain-containing protein n=1 Tax=Streptomyces sp. NPDC101237 TaxID=3366139 RepID=UPI00382C49CA